MRSWLLAALLAFFSSAAFAQTAGTSGMDDLTIAGPKAGTNSLTVRLDNPPRFAASSAVHFCTAGLETKF